MDQTSQAIEIRINTSMSFVDFGVVVSLRSANYEMAKIVVGAPGLPNVVKEFELGDALLFETVTAGVIEVRLSALRPPSAEVLATKISPRLGLTAGLAIDGGQNEPFSVDEVQRIRGDLSAILDLISKRNDVTREQLELLARKLDEISAASERLGRKDWLMFVAGTVTNVVVGAAFPAEVTKALFTAMNSNLGWAFQNAVRLLGM